MTKRMRSVGIAIAVLAASAVTTTKVGARSSGDEGGSSSSRSCLTSEARGLLSRIEQKFGPMSIISTCRPGARIEGSGRPSRHASGNAIDFEAGGRKGAVVKWLVANHHSGGTMTYSGMSHIHVDIGSHFVSLADASDAETGAPKAQPGRMALFGPSGPAR